MAAVGAYVVDSAENEHSKMDILRGVITEKFTVAVQEILAVVETAVAGYDHEVLLLRRELDDHKKQLDAILQPKVTLHEIQESTDTQEPAEQDEDAGGLEENTVLSGNFSPAEEEPPRDEDDSFVECPNPEEPQYESDCSLDINDLSPLSPAEEEPDKDEEDTRRRRYRVKTKATHHDNEEEHEAKRRATSELEEEPQGSGHEAELKDELEDGRLPDSAAENDTNEDEEHSAASMLMNNLGDPKCQVCGLLFNSTSVLAKHALRYHVDTENVVCGVCGQHLDTPAQMKTHLETHVKCQQCGKCGKYFLSWRGFQDHRVVCQTGQKPRPSVSLQKFFQCDRCILSFRFKSQLETHYRKHTGEKPFCCDICGKHLSTFPIYCDHLQSHTNEKNYRCEHCGKGFSNKRNLSKHEIIHLDRDKTHLCELCCAAFHTSVQLKNHQLRKHGEMPLVSCPVCGKQLRGDLQNHMRTHTGEKPYTCAVCGVGFKTNSAHKNHMDVHLGVKRFSCPVCEYKCSRKEHLKVHMSTHTGEKPYECSLCSAAFTQSHCLKSHMKSHGVEEQSPPEASADDLQT